MQTIEVKARGIGRSLGSAMAAPAWMRSVSMRGITENCEYAVKPIITAVNNIGGPMERRVARVIRSMMNSSNKAAPQKRPM